MNLIERGLKAIWHPCSQMKDYEAFAPLLIKSARGCYIELEDGRQIIDAISSWWCKSLGHNHPRLKKVLHAQLERFEHVILANTTHENIILLSEKLTGLTEKLKKIFYASEGSSAVEIALKMSLHTRILCGENQRNRFMSLSNAYHGETALALSVSDVALYSQAYSAILIKSHLLTNIPYVSNQQDPLWQDCSDYWPTIEKQLNQHAAELTAIIVEPILQGAAGMLIYSQDFLKRLRAWTKKNGVHLIADEIMTGFGRTGCMFAYQHAEIEPDFLCVGKGLTSGWLPLSAVLLSDEIYHAFYHDYEHGKNFLHSHTFSGNALAVAVALETLKIIEEETICRSVKSKESIMLKRMTEVAEQTGKLTKIRNIGAMVAADLIVDNTHSRMGFKVFQQATKLGALLRPLGNTIYWLPPLTISEETLAELQNITSLAIQKAYA